MSLHISSKGIRYSWYLCSCILESEDKKSEEKSQISAKYEWDHWWKKVNFLAVRFNSKAEAEFLSFLWPASL